MGAYAVAMETLTERASLLSESMQKAQVITENRVSILGSFDHRLSALETAMRPTQLKTHSIRRAHENLDKSLKVADSILEQFDRSREAEAKILRGPHEDLESYLEAVEQLRSIIKFFTGNKAFKNGIGVVNQANTLLGKAIQKLDEEFRQLLSAYSKPVEPDRLFDCLPTSMRPPGSPREDEPAVKKSSDNHNNSSEPVVYQLPTLIPPRLLPLLHEIAKQMVGANHQQQVAILYREARASAVEQTLRKLGVEKLGKDDVQKMQWEVLEAKIGNWIHFMRIAIKLLFAGEKKVCDEIFNGFDNLRDQCSAEVTGTSVIMLLSFSDYVKGSFCEGSR